MNCLCCPNPVKSWRKYCSRACYRKAKRVIDPLEAIAMRERGITCEQMTAVFPAAASSIRKAIKRFKAAA